MTKIIEPSVTIPFAGAAALGQLPGIKAIGKWGRAPNGVQATSTDIWDRADATPTQQVWTAPTQARVHNVKSAHANDAAAGVGLQTVQVYGLTAWDTPEVSEIVTMNGTTNVATSNAYVIIHRMKAITWGSSGPNVGLITATAVTDATITAVILAGIGQTRMAIYGIASGQKLVLDHYYASILATGGATVSVDIALEVNSIPDTQLAGFVTKHETAVTKDGTGSHSHQFTPPFVATGPAIIKVTATASTADTDLMAGFGGIVVDV